MLESFLGLGLSDFPDALTVTLILDPELLELEEVVSSLSGLMENSESVSYS